jgi:hypothetical protein
MFVNVPNINIFVPELLIFLVHVFSHYIPSYVILDRKSVFMLMRNVFLPTPESRDVFPGNKMLPPTHSTRTVAKDSGEHVIRTPPMCLTPIACLHYIAR